MPDWNSRQRSFFDQMWPLAVGASTRTGVPAEVIFAQSALETGWGRSAPQNNYFGIKGAGGSQQTREFINGRWVTINDSFRGYSSMADSVEGYVAFINNPNSQRWGAARNASSPEEAARAIAAGGYATDPNYASKLMSIIRNIPNPFRVAPSGTGASQSVPTDAGSISAHHRSVFGEWDGSLPNAPGLFESGGFLDRITTTPTEVKENVMGGVQKIIDGLEGPVKRVGFVVIGVLLLAIAVFVILKGPQAAVTAASAVVTKGKSLGQKAAMEAVA